MSRTAVFVVLLFAAGIYASVNILTRIWKHSGRDPVHVYWSSSQWDPNGINVISTCTGPLYPGTCIIEGVQPVSSASATRTCAASVCIDFDGSNVKGDNIPFRATCNIPYCSWSECLLTFDGAIRAFLLVDIPSKTINVTTIEADATRFYMERQTISGSGKRVPDQGGTLAQFFIIPTPQNKATSVILLGYMNTATIAQRPDIHDCTKLGIFPRDSPPDGSLDIFLLLDALPQSVSENLPGAFNIVPKKILPFGGNTRVSNPSPEVLRRFINPNQTDMWKALNANRPMPIIAWQYNAFYGLQEDDYVIRLNSWTSISALLQDALETRLKSEDVERVFYIWS